MGGQRRSRQRDVIWECVKDRRDHPTADDIFEAVRKELPSVSLATVYRNLMVLQELGRLRTVDVGDKVMHFDPRTSDHQHFRCTRCGRLYDVETPEVEAAIRAMDLSDIGTVSSFNLCLEGVCVACAHKNQAKP